jgi:hypothetical protein
MLFVDLVDVSNGCVEGLLGQLASFASVISDLIEEH